MLILQSSVLFHGIDICWTHKGVLVEIISKIRVLESFIEDPSKGLPEEVYLFASRITPLVNVDLLIKDEQNRTLMSWREDEVYGIGWHLPGGIIRFKETMAKRIRAVAKQELGVEVEFEPTPIAINQVIHPSSQTRGHCISLLFRCSLLTSPNQRTYYQSEIPQPGQWTWYNACPEDIIEVHRMYEAFI